MGTNVTPLGYLCPYLRLGTYVTPLGGTTPVIRYGTGIHTHVIVCSILYCTYTPYPLHQIHTYRYHLPRYDT